MLGQRLAGRDADAQPLRAGRRACISDRRGSAAKRSAPPQKIVGCSRRMMLEHRVGRRPAGEQHRGRADRHREGQRIAEPVGEEQLRRRIDHVVLAHAERLLREQLARSPSGWCGVPRALRHAGRARGVEPERRLVRMRRGGLRTPSLSCANAGRSVRWGVSLGGADHDELDARQFCARLLERRQQRLRHEGRRARGCRPGCRRIAPAVSSVLSGTGTMPARIAPRKMHREIDRVEQHQRDAILAPQRRAGAGGWRAARSRARTRHR